MKVAYCIRADWDSPTNKGGDTTQLLKTMKNVMRYSDDVMCDVLTNPEMLDNSYDIAHIFNFATLDISTRFFDKAKSVNVKIAFSTIFWDYSYGYHMISKYFDLNVFKKIDRLLFLTLGKMINLPIVLSTKFKNQILKFLEGSDVLLPNSIEEYYKICDFVDINPSKYINKVSVVFNAADISENIFMEKNEFLKKYKLPDKPYVLQVGRIQLIKGQLTTLKALYKMDIPIVFVGFVAEVDYFNKIKKIAQKRGNVYFVDYVENTEVSNFYKHAALHILPSLRESPGLVSLEALLNGCKVVTSNDKYLPFNSYFNDIATAIDPVDFVSIERGVEKELNMSRDFDKIKNLILNEFSWNKVGIDTFNAYKKIL
ncbi:glycosyltransferase family 4 protein [Chryseobacterium mulctrae]|uniref:glycosyltransferase family 4 protein n=1 Tax=Chryseobacterium mulctrae TaxID=2576777 RepID=UPI0011171F8D|nr:glycosyltransferase [Chryseobacterium mulctrae]